MYQILTVKFDICLQFTIFDDPPVITKQLVELRKVFITTACIASILSFTFCQGVFYQRCTNFFNAKIVFPLPVVKKRDRRSDCEQPLRSDCGANITRWTAIKLLEWYSKQRHYCLDLDSVSFQNTDAMLS